MVLMRTLNIEVAYLYNMTDENSTAKNMVMDKHGREMGPQGCGPYCFWL
jgi:hypothetical protein